MQGEAIVLDSSTIASVYFTDSFSSWSSDVVRSWKQLYTLDLAYIEVANVAWKRVYLFKQPKEIILEGLQKALDFIDNICLVESSRAIVPEAIDVSLEIGVAIYDALYVCLARRNNIPLATLDRKLVEKLKGTKYGTILLHPYL